MAEQDQTTSCSQCAELEGRIDRLETRLAEMTDKLAAAQKNSTTSSKPPSSDLVKPPKRNLKKGRRKRGAQPGHPKHERQAFPPEEIDRTQDYHLPCCPDCGGEVEPLDQPAQTLQQIELVVKPVEVTEHRSRSCHCGKCDKNFAASIPSEVQAAGLIGPHLTARLGYLKGACHCSYSTIQNYCREVLGVAVSRGQLRKVCGKLADSLGPAYEELLAALPHEDRVNIDETGHKENGQRMWTWCFRAELFTFFRIDPSRSSAVLVDTLGLEFDGVLGCDYFSAYRKYMRLNENVLVQFCLAHLIRDVRFLIEHPQPKNQAYGKRVLAELRALFAIIHRRDEFAAEADFRGALEDQALEVWSQATYRVPTTTAAQNLADRFRNHGREYIQFVTTPGVEPTNNLAEQAIRFVVLDRRVTQGTRSAAGRQWCERIWTVLATCAQHGQSTLDFLHRSLQAHFGDKPPPSLRFNT